MNSNKPKLPKGSRAKDSNPAPDDGKLNKRKETIMSTQTISTKSQLCAMLMKRDHCTKEEAKYRINLAQQLINEIMEYAPQLDDIEDILADVLGIELDYIYLFIM